MHHDASVCPWPRRPCQALADVHKKCTQTIKLWDISTVDRGYDTLYQTTKKNWSLVSLVITTSCQQSTFYIGAPHMNSGRSARATAVMAHTSPAQKAHRLAPTKVLQHVHGKNVNRKNWSNCLHVPETNPKNIANNQGEKKINKYASPSHSYSGVAAREPQTCFMTTTLQEVFATFWQLRGQHRFMHSTVPYFSICYHGLSAQLQKMQKYYCAPPPYKH